MSKRSRSRKVVKKEFKLDPRLLAIVPVVLIAGVVIYLVAFRKTNPTGPVTANAQWTPEVQSFDGVEMVKVPPGCFVIGDEIGQDEAKNGNEICFDKPFWIDKTEVTQAQFKRLGGQAANPPTQPGDDRPIETVTWFEARDFCEKRGARLPTEAEWEYAARGPDDLVFPWGDTVDDTRTVNRNNSNSQTATVGSKPSGASWVGALDMSGNVWEWVSSIMKPYPYVADDGREDAADTNEYRGVRGGSIFFTDARLSAIYRSSNHPSIVSLDYGFRCARSDVAK